MQCERPIWTGFARVMRQIFNCRSSGRQRWKDLSVVVEMPNQIPNARDIWRMIAVRDKPPRRLCKCCLIRPSFIALVSALEILALLLAELVCTV